MIITCPNCQTKYQVAFEAIGSAGRKVQCANCQKAWKQPALPEPGPAPRSELKVVPKAEQESDKLFETMAEEALDEAIVAEERATVAHDARLPEPVKPVEGLQPAKRRQSAAEVRERQKALSRRQTAMVSRLPMARMRRAARVAGAILLAAILAVAYFGRVQIVDRNPDLAGIYEAVGLGVNVVGLELSGLQSMRQSSQGRDVLVVSAQIVGLMPEPVAVPPVLVSLLDETGRAIYEWSVAPRIRDLMAGERATFDTRLPLPPSEAVGVRLSFASGGASAGADPERSPSPSVGDGPQALRGGPAVVAPGAQTDQTGPETSDSPVEAQASAVHH